MTFKLLSFKYACEWTRRFLQQYANHCLVTSIRLLCIKCQEKVMITLS